MQTILGAGGVIGKGLARELKKYEKRIRLVGRHPVKINEDDEIISADLTNKSDADRAVNGSHIVYITAGLDYRTHIWREKWPAIMNNVLDACSRYGAHLVFFDNVYMYGRVNGWMTEDTPADPVSKKGEIRKTTAALLLHAVERKKIRALIARSADFYGPGAENTFVHQLVFKRLMEGKQAQWIANADIKHSFTYTPDAIEGTALLGNTMSAYDQIWHLPTDRNALTGREFIELAAREFNAGSEPKIITNWMAIMGGLFSPLIKENVEMSYQYQYEYLFDSKKIEKEFNYKPVPYQDGIKQTAEYMKLQKELEEEDD